MSSALVSKQQISEIRNGIYSYIVCMESVRSIYTSCAQLDQKTLHNKQKSTPTRLFIVDIDLFTTHRIYVDWTSI